MGRGYWLKLSPQTPVARMTVSVTGIPPATDTDLLVPCTFGWNLVGSPFNGAIDLSKVLVKHLQNEPISWADAVDQNLVAAQPFGLPTSRRVSSTQRRERSSRNAAPV